MDAIQKGLAGPPRYLILTTSRAHPTKTGTFEEFLTERQEAPFHYWLDAAGRSTSVRPASDFVLPDGVDPSPAAFEICAQSEVACLSGLFWCARTQTHGSNPLPIALHNLEAFVTRWCSTNGRQSTLSVVGAWELGAEAYAVEDLVAFIRGLRGQPELFAPSNMALFGEPALTKVSDQRNALSALGFTVAHEDVNGRWMTLDQKALLEFQRQTHLRVTGWWDPLTKAALREALRRGP